MSDRGDVVEWVETTEEVIIIEECLLPNGNCSAVLPVSQPTDTPMQKLLDTMVQGEDAEFDDGFYCDECRSLFQEQSSVCIAGPSFVLDSPTNMAVPQRALLTLPHGLMIGRSSIPNTGLGVMNQGPAVTPGMHFGPYEGEIYKVNYYDYIDAARETHSNWMRYVNCARNQEETNLLAVQYKGSILFHCCRTIHPGDELVVWPSGGLLSRLSEAWNHIWLMKLPPIESNPGIASQTFLCSHCPLSFTTETYRQRHMEHFHTQSKKECTPPGAEAAEPQDQDNAPAEDIATPATTNPVDSLIVVDTFEAKTCSECGKIFKHMHHLKRHMLSVHSNKRPYCCPLCRRSFSQASGLLRHQMVHKKQAFSEAPSDQNQSCQQGTETEMEMGVSLQTPALPDTSSCEEAVASRELPGTEEATVAEHTAMQESRPLEEAKGTGPEKKTNTCVQCDKSFSNGQYLEKHKTRVHGNLRPYVCTLCRKTFSQLHDLARHLKSHQAKDKSEKACTALMQDGEESSDVPTDESQDQDTEDRDLAAEPSAPKIAEPPKEPVYQRPQRLGVRSKISAITKLIAPKRRTPVNKRKSQSPARVVPESREESDVSASTQEGQARMSANGGTYSCAHCKLKYESDEALKEHACAAAPHRCAHCGATFKKAGFLKRHERTAHVHAKSYACSVCGKAFGKLFNLKQHQKIKSCDKHHCTSEIFSCAYCPFSFTIRSYLCKHVRRHHPLEYLSLSESERLADGPEDHGDEEEEKAAVGEAHICQKCGKKYASAKNYTVHRCCQQAILYLCTDCGKGFPNRYGLKQHQRVHTGVRPHGCPHCHKTFVHMGQLNVHLRTHTGEKPYLCTHCGESFRQSGDLKRHERKHTGVRPHICSECFKCFSRPQSLRAHQMLHLGQRMFKCNECGKSFSRNYHLRTHQQKMHS
ncbi:Histone-lysine N-methyltransferase PRDM9 [Merluccius polli]|uniref:Histone-lysine N-methyltransferase PRDM9 n=1 Tax=Merluccius polli TaxID=89951 RepID=A0AA47N305_MERPO|nr:Histone-lysine N-methyltransferase PRDM9 [Merluccius polli]